MIAIDTIEGDEQGNTIFWIRGMQGHLKLGIIASERFTTPDNISPTLRYIIDDMCARLSHEVQLQQVFQPCETHRKKCPSCHAKDRLAGHS